MADQNKKTIRMLREEAPTNPSVLDGLYADDYVYHGIPLLGDLKGPAATPSVPAGARIASDCRVRPPTPRR